MENTPFSGKTSSFLPDPESGRARTRCRMALEILEKVLDCVFEERKSADSFLHHYFRMDRRIGSRDRKFYSTLIFGVLRYYGSLRRAFSVREKSLIFYCTAVCAAENIFPGELKGFLELLGLDPLQTFSGDTFRERLDSFLLSCGEKIVENTELFGDLFYKYIPFEGDGAFVDRMQKRPPLWLRCNSAQNREKIAVALEKMGFPVKRDPFVREALALCGEKRLNLQEFASYRNGEVEVQDLSSQAIGLCAPLEKGQFWWDCCAGGGGKTLLLGARLQEMGGGSIVASDIREWKLTELLSRAGRAHLRNIKTCVWNGADSLPEENFRERFDGVLVDAPCSSSGRWRRNPEGRFLLTEEDLFSITQLQYSILCSAAPAVKKGGVLLYGTCSFFTVENEGNVQKFLSEHPDFALEDFPHPLTGEPSGGMMRVIPSETRDCDGSFCARFRRKK